VMRDQLSVVVGPAERFDPLHCSNVPRAPRGICP
jgi:hypothetical protein